MQIISATIEHVLPVQALISLLNSQHADIEPQTFLQDAPYDITFKWLESLISDANAEVLLATVGAEVVGLVEVCVMPGSKSPWIKPDRQAYIGSLIVAETFRGNGVGRLLTHAAEAWAQDRACRVIRLDVFAENESAIQAYEHFGFLKRSQSMIKQLGQG